MALALAFQIRGARALKNDRPLGLLRVVCHGAHGIPCVADRGVLNGIFRLLRSAVPWRDLPESYGPLTTWDSFAGRGQVFGTEIRLAINPFNSTICNRSASETLRVSSPDKLARNFLAATTLLIGTNATIRSSRECRLFELTRALTRSNKFFGNKSGSNAVGRDGLRVEMCGCKSFS